MRYVYPMLLGMLLSTLCTDLFAQTPEIWTPVADNAIGPDLFQNRQRPRGFRLARLNETLFRSRMADAPSEKTISSRNSSFIVSFPDRQGGLQDFRVVDAPVMHPALAARYPGIRSYAGTSLSDPSVTIRFAVTPAGFHGTIVSPGTPTVYIDPAGKPGDNLYQIVSREDLGSPTVFRCFTTENGLPDQAQVVSKAGSADDGQLRTYKLALCASLTFSQFFLTGAETTDAQRKAVVMAELVTLVTRANQTFEREIAVRLELVAGNDQLISVSTADNPWASGNLNTITQTVCDTRIGSANYDIGHLVNRGQDNGNAGYIGSVCVAGAKGSAFTTYSNPAQTEFFVVDFLVHEMGHQFGANHTFSMAFENTAAQVEPGSGSTIMGYAGITNANVQEHSDDYFSAASIAQMTDYLKSGAGVFCGVNTNTGNIAPVVEAGPNYTIPHSTPFTLTGTASDANDDPLSFTWEQYNRMTAATPSFPTTTSVGPVFRSYRPTSSISRTFPDLPSILNGSNTNTWEKLPSVTRTLNFRFTARDNRAGGAANSFDEMTVQVNSSAGPFLVTSANSAGTNWEEDSDQIITWDVAGSTAAPVSCSLVNILFSTDGGQSFPIILASATPNDGSELVRIPGFATSTGRIKVEAVGNIFFDINNANITTTAYTDGFRFGSPAAQNITCASVNSVSYTLTSTGIAGYNQPITLSAGTLPAGVTVSFAPATINPGQQTLVTVSGINTLSTGLYNILVDGTTSDLTRSRALALIIEPGAGPGISAQPQSISPCEGTNASFSVTATGAIVYQWRVKTSANGAFVNLPGQTAATLNLSAVSPAQNGYEYDVAVTGNCGTTFSAPATLIVRLAPSVSTQPQNQSVCLGNNALFSVSASGTAITYLWQVSSDGSTYTTAPGLNNQATYSISSVSSALNNNRYRVVVTGACSPALTSEAAILSVVNPPAVAAQGNPVPQVICESGAVSFNVTATGATLYQWQVSTNGGASYSNLSNGGNYAGVTTASLNISDIGSALNNNLYRVALSNSTCTSPVYSAGAMLTVNDRPTVNLAAAPLTTLLPGQSTTITASINPAPTGFDITWFRDDQILPGVTGTSYLVDSVAVGDYKVRIINQVTGCNNESAPLTIGTSSSSRLFVFPNPNSGQFTVSYYNSAGTSTRQMLTVFDSKGSLIYQASLNVSGPYTLNNINISGVGRGVYHVVIGDASGKKITQQTVLIR